MRFEIGLILVTGFVVANIYTEGKYLKKLLSYKKYYQIAGIVFGAFVLYWLVKYQPNRANQMIKTSHEYLKYLPVDNNMSSILSPILDFTSKNSFSSGALGAAGALGAGALGAGALAEPSTSSFLGGMFSSSVPEQPMHAGRILQSGKKSTKRSVSETKKKFVASSQNWKCGDCGNQLTAWFEVDHKVRLEYGGSNHIDNLVALCRECHGKKTTIENL